MPDDNTVQVTTLELDEVTWFGSEDLALAMPLADVQNAAVSAAEPPNFGTGPEPTEDGLALPAADGTPYYRPYLRVADRAPGLLAGPDVWFLRDGHGAIRLEWTLADSPPAGVPAEAVPVPVVVDTARMVWNGGERAFDPPGVEPVDHSGDGPRFLLRGGAQLLPDEAKTLELAMSDAASGCRLEVDYSYTYLVETPGVPDRVRMWLSHLDVDSEMDRESLRALFLPEDQEGKDRLKKIGLDSAEIERDLPDLEPRHQSVRRAIPFVFNPNDDANRLVYRGLRGAAQLTGEWRKSAAGWVRDSGLPNTVYRIPDEVRLAFDPRLGAPHVITTLHRDDAGKPAVRVLLRVAPWQDPRNVVQTRELVGAAAAQVVVGPAPGAVLRLGGSFPEGIRIVGNADGGGIAFPLAEGADLLLDLSLEYFQLLCGMLGGAIGLPGQVEVPLAQTADGPAPVTVQVPVTLRMDLVSDLPVGVQVLNEGAVSPTAVRVTNRSGTAIRVGGCHAVLLQIGANSVIPLAAHQARCTTTFPVELPAAGTAELAFEPVELQEGAWWNAILVDLLDKAMVEDARAMLLKANQLAGTGELTWDLRVSCPVFATTPLPPRWSNLVAVEVEVSAPGFDTTTLVLRPDTPSRTVTLRKPLTELVSGGASGIRTAGYRVRNNYTDHQGQWTAAQQQSGEELIVYPNPGPDD